MLGTIGKKVANKRIFSNILAQTVQFFFFPEFLHIFATIKKFKN